MIVLRDYQKEAVNKILGAWESNENNLLLTCATGGGKTAIFLSVIHQIYQENPGSRFLILAHRKELIEQPIDRMIGYYPDWFGKIGIVMAEIDQPDRIITVATVQTLQAPGRLEKILSYGKIDYLIIDEAHHATADTYLKVYEDLKKINPDLKNLGVTATPIRADGDGLSKVYTAEVAHYGIVELIKLGYLVPVRWLGIQVGVSLAGVKTVAGDFNQKQLSNVFETQNVYELVVQSHLKYAQERQAIAFTVTVDGAYDLAQEFNKQGIIAAAADGTTNKKERRAILDDFRAGKIQVLCNVGLYTEGLDVPEVSCIHQVRPTRSDGLYTQMIGRGLRIFPGKQDALILDYCPIDSRNIAMAGDVLGTPLRKDSYIEPKEEPGEVVGGFTFDGSYNWLAGNPAEIISRQLDYLDASPFTWYRLDGWMTLGLGKAQDEIERTLVISPPQDGEIKVYLAARRPQKNYWEAWKIEAAGNQFDEAMKWCDEYTSKRGSGALITKKRQWRNRAPSEGQIKYARRIKGCYKADIRPWTMGEFANRITHFLAVGAVREYEKGY